MNSHSNSESLPLPTSSCEGMPVPAAREALAIVEAEGENGSTEVPPQKRSRFTEAETSEVATAEATSSTSSSTASTSLLAATVIETAEATPVKQSSPPWPTAGREVEAVVKSCLSSPVTSTLRKFRQIPILIVEYHNDVLEFLYRCLATRHLPLENNILVHFDSHPDLVINRSISAAASYDKHVMLEKLGIESWIMPLVFTGHFNRIVWLKNSWCQQIPVGKYNIKVGQKNDQLCVDSTLDYFLAEGNYCPAIELKECRDLELQVFNADTDDVKPDFISPSDAQSFVLDIDLDFFSTQNPFLDIYSLANCYERLTEIFYFEISPKDNSGTCERRQQQLNELRIIFEHLESNREMDNLPTSVYKVISHNVIDKIKLLRDELLKHYPEETIDWLIIYDSGCTTDSGGLPHHVSTQLELNQYFSNLKDFLERLPVPPVAVTIACSSEDDYCPKHQVQAIENRVVQLLRQVFGDRMHSKPILHYKCDNWDVMKL